jgi:hypothetical protein
VTNPPLNKSNWQAKGRPAFALGDLQNGAKALARTDVAPRKVESKDAAAETEEMQTFLEELYVKHKGDLDEIFSELNENPGKAKKYPPENETVFAEKYRAGFYSYISEENKGKAESKD